MKTSFSCTVKYADVDSSMQIRLANLLNYLLEAGDDSVTKTGISTPFLRDNYNAAWVLCNVNMMIYSLPKYGMELEIETWVEKKAHQLVVRNFTVRADKEGESVVMARVVSLWSIIDLDTRQIASAVFDDEELWKPCYDPTSLHLPRMPRKGVATPDRVIRRRVAYSDADFNDHLNSCKYVSYMMDACPFLTAKAPIWFDIKYSKEIRRVEEATIRLHAKDDEIEYEILNQKGELACSAVLTTF